MIEFTPIPVGFELERFGSASIDLHEWMRLRSTHWSLWSEKV